MLVRQSSGPLPVAPDLHEYTPDERERIFRIAEAFSTDESKRRDKMVDSGTKVAEREQILRTWQLAAAFALCLGSYVLYQNVVFSGLFLSLPVLRVIGSTVTTAVRRRRSGDDEDGE